MDKKSADILSRYGFIIALVLIVSSIAVIYSGVIEAPFVFDDTSYVKDNPKIRSLSNLWPPEGTRYMGYLSFALNYSLGGLDVTGYHLVNILIHVFNSVLVFLLARLSFKTPWFQGSDAKGESLAVGVALVASLVFAVHPVQTQAVTYITQRFASLTTMFYLLSLVLYIQWRLLAGKSRPYKAALFALSVISAVLAQKTKEISFTLPFIIVFYEFLFFRERDFKKRALFLAPYVLALAIVPLSLFMPASASSLDVDETLRKMQIKELESLSSHDYFTTQLRVMVTYIRLLLLPINQNLDYDYPLFRSAFNPEVLLSALFLSFIMALAIYLFARARKENSALLMLVSAGVFWFFIASSIESSVIPILDVIFEHRMYLPSVGAAIAFSSAAFYAFSALKKKLKLKTGLPGAAATFLIIFALPLAAAAYNRNAVWKDPLGFLQDIAKKSPGKSRVRYNLGNEYVKLARYDEAISEYKAAIELKPDHVEARNNLALAYQKKGAVDNAIEEFQKAIELKPDYVDARNNLGTAYQKKGLLDKAVDVFEVAISISPLNPEGHYNLADAYEKSGRIEDAIGEYRQALRLRPSYMQALNNLSNIYLSLGKIDEALDGYKKALEFAPEGAEIHNNIGIIYRMKGSDGEALAEYDLAIRYNPGFAEAYNNIGNLYKDQKKWDNAYSAYKNALALRPDYVDAHYNLGDAYYKSGRLDDAEAEFETLLKIRPQDAQARFYLASVYREAGKSEQALTHYRMFVETAPRGDEKLLRQAKDAIKKLGSRKPL